MDATFEEKVLKQVEELDKIYMRELRLQFAGDALGTTSKLTDEEFFAFFSQKARVNPYWVFALSFAEGGKEWLQRYDRIRANLTMNGGQPWLRQ